VVNAAEERFAFSPETITQIQNDPNLDQAALDNPAMVYLDLWEDEDAGIDDVNGIAYYRRRRTQAG
jgi:hypothetical protein